MKNIAKSKTAAVNAKLDEKQKLVAAIVKLDPKQDKVTLIAKPREQLRELKRKLEAKASEPAIPNLFPDGDYEVLVRVPKRGKKPEQYVQRGIVKGANIPSSFDADSKAIFQNVTTRVAYDRSGAVVAPLTLSTPEPTDLDPKPETLRSPDAGQSELHPSDTKAAPAAPAPKPASKRYESKTPADSAYHNRNRSECESPVAVVWNTCNKNNKKTRKEIIALCVELGVDKNTAATQYSHWNKLRTSLGTATAQKPSKK